MSGAGREVEGRRVKLSNLEKVLFPVAGLTKADLIDYYERVAPVMLPHLSGRPLSLERYPDGIDAEGFMQKNASALFPEVDPARAPRQAGWRGRSRGRRGCADAGLSRQSGLREPARRAVAHRPDRPSGPDGARSRPVGSRISRRSAARRGTPGRCSRRSASCPSSRPPARAACTFGCRSIARPTSTRCARSPPGSPRCWWPAARRS